jgi:hypothetical protein
MIIDCCCTFKLEKKIDHCLFRGRNSIFSFPFFIIFQKCDTNGCVSQSRKRSELPASTTGALDQTGNHDSAAIPQKGIQEDGFTYEDIL